MLKKSILILVILLVSACRRYPEGGININVRKKIYGEKELVSYTVNGADSFAYLKSMAFQIDSVHKLCEHPTFDFYRYSNTVYEFHISCNDFYLAYNNWQVYYWSPPRSDTIGIGFAYTDYPPTSYDSLRSKIFDHHWAIVRLKKKDFWVQREENGNVYKLKFKEL